LNTDFLLIGQGISGTWLSYFLEQYGVEHLVIDDGFPGSSSRLAGGLINPVTGRNKVKTWLADHLLPYCHEQYQAMGNLLHEKVIEEKKIIECFTNQEAIRLFTRRVNENPEYLHLDSLNNDYGSYFKNIIGFGLIHPAYLVRMETLLASWRNRLKKQNQLIETFFDTDKLIKYDSGFSYENINCKKIIYCDGIGLRKHKLATKIPLAPTKGEALIVKIPGLPQQTIFKNKLTLLPQIQKDQWWVGSSVEWEFETEIPTLSYREQTMEALHNWIQLPIEFIEQRAAIRMGTMERRPLVGLDPAEKRIGYFNGMGTKGCSLAPYFANQLVRNILYQESIHAEAIYSRFL
jgi:glycine/D-amino acid oxidase-like deaminating enzyme